MGMKESAELGIWSIPLLTPPFMSVIPDSIKRILKKKSSWSAQLPEFIKVTVQTSSARKNQSQVNGFYLTSGGAWRVCVFRPPADRVGDVGGGGGSGQGPTVVLSLWARPPWFILYFTSLQTAGPCFYFILNFFQVKLKRTLPLTTGKGGGRE